MTLTRKQIQTMKRHAIDTGNIIDARGMRGSDAKLFAKKNHCEFMIWIPCRNCNNTIRTRHNICIDCNPQAISQMRQYNAPGFVYIAISKGGGFIKVGSSRNMRGRLSVLRCGYAGFRDWEIFASIFVENMGACEKDIKEIMTEQKIQRSYIHSDGNKICAAEIFNMTPWQAYGALVGTSVFYGANFC